MLRRLVHLLSVLVLAGFLADTATAQSGLPPRVIGIEPSPLFGISDQIGLGEIRIAFSEDVAIPEGALAIIANDGTSITSFSTLYQLATNTLVVTFAEPIVNDRVTVVIDDTVEDFHGLALDGEIAIPTMPAFPSGDFTAGGQAVVQYSVLQGDASRDGEVGTVDQQIVLLAFGLCDGDAGFDPRADLNRDGCVNVVDVNILQEALEQELALPVTDGEAPAVVGQEPSAGDVVRDDGLSIIEFTLSERVLQSSLTTERVAVLTPKGALRTPVTIEFDGTAVRASFLPAISGVGPVRVLVSNAIRDASGLLLANDPPTSWDFELDAAPATIIETSPAPDESAVALTRETIITFEHPLQPETVTPSAFVAEFGQVPLAVQNLHLSADARRVTMFYEDALPASAAITVSVVGDLLLDDLGLAVDADGDGIPGGIGSFQFQTLSLTPLENTTVCGRVFASELDDEGMSQPLQGVVITVDGMESSLVAVTDRNGNFCLDPAPVGTFFVHVDGRTASNVSTPPGAFYPFVGKTWTSIANQKTNVGNVFLPLVVDGTLQPVSGREPVEIEFPESVIADFPELDGTRISVPAGSLFADDGTQGGMVGIAPVAPDRLPGELPGGLDFPLVITVQVGPQGDGGPLPTNFDTPVPVRFPNLPDPDTGETLAPGERTSLWSFDHDLGRWKVNGSLTVSDDGLWLESDEGTGIRAPGWHGGGNGSNGSGDGSDDDGPCMPEGGNSVTETIWNAGEAAYRCVEPIYRKKIGRIIRAALEALGCIDDVGALIDQLFGLVEDNDPGNCDEIQAALSSANLLLAKIITAVDIYRGASVVSTLQVAWNCLSELLSFIASFCTPCEEPPPPGCDPPSVFLCAVCVAIDVVDDYVGFVNGLLGQAGDLEERLSEAAVQFLQLKLAQAETFANLLCNGDGDPERVAEELLAVLVELEIALLEMQQAVPVLQALEQPVQQLLAELEDRVADSAAGVQDVTGLLDEPAAYALEIGDPEDSSSFVIRSSTGPTGAYSAVVPNDEYYRVSFFLPDSFEYGQIFGFTAPVGQATDFLPVIVDDASKLPDSDGDQLPDDVEFVLGTDADEPDSDGDGVPDGAEVAQGTDPLDGLVVQTGIVASVQTAGVAKDVAAIDNLAAVALGGAGVAIFNVFDGMDPIIVAQFPVSGDARDVSCSPQFVSIAAGGGGVRIIDISDPADAFVAGSINAASLGGSANATEIVGSTLFVGTESGRLVSIDLGSGSLLETIDLGASVQDLAIDGTWLYVLAGAEVHAVRAIETPLQVVASASSPGAVNTAVGRNRLRVGSGIAYATHRRGFNTIDVSDPTNPSLIQHGVTAQFGWKQIVPNGSGRGIACVSPNQAFDGPHNVSMFDVSDPKQTDEFLTEFPTPGVARAIAIFNGLAYVADNASGLQVINYLPYDSAGVPPTVEVTTNQAGSAIVEGSLIVVDAAVADDVQVRNAKLLVDGEVVQTDGDFPFQFYLPAPTDVAGIEIVVRATDTGGNTTDATPVVFEIVPDTVSPVVQNTIPVPSSVIFGSYFESGAISIGFDEPMDPMSLGGGAVSMIAAGADGRFGTSDDEALAIEYGLLTLGRLLAVTATELPIPLGPVRVILDGSSVRDLAGNLLDGDGDGVGGDDFELDLDIIAQPDVFWVGSDGDWNNASNWSSGAVPTEIDDVTLAVDGSPTITHSSGSNAVYELLSIEPFVMSGGVLHAQRGMIFEGPLAFAGGALSSDEPTFLIGPLEWTGGTVSGEGLLVGAGAIAIAGDVVVERPVRAESGMTATSGAIALAGASLTTFGLLETPTDGSVQFVYAGGDALLRNEGTMRQDGGGVTAIGPGIEFQSPGTIEVDSGTLQIASRTTTTGLVRVEPDAVLRVLNDFASTAEAILSVSGTMELLAGMVVLDGEVDLAGPVVIDGAEVSLAVPLLFAGNLTFDSGVVAGPADLTSTGVLQWRGGRMAGIGRTVNEGILVVDALATDWNRRVINEGQVVWQRGAIGLDGGVAETRPGATFLMSLADDAVVTATDAPGLIDNAGMLQKTGAGTATFGVGVSVENSGDIRVDNGRIIALGPIATTGGIELSSGGCLGSFDHFTLAAGSVATGAGELDLRAGQASIDGLLDMSGSFRCRGAAVTVGPGAHAVGSIALIGGELILRTGATFEVSDAVEITGPGLLEVRLSGEVDPALDAIIVADGELTADSTLRVVLEDGYVPEVGAVFDLVLASEVSGVFTSLDLPRLPRGDFMVEYEADRITLIVH